MNCLLVAAALLVGAAVSTAPLPRSTPSRVRVGEGVQVYKLRHLVRPSLPHGSRLSGVVKLEVLIGKDGRVRELHAISGHPLLYGPAMDAVRQWEYEPTYIDRKRVEVFTTVHVPFPFHDPAGYKPRSTMGTKV